MLDIHLEGIDDKGEKLEILAETGKPFNISVVPVLMMPEHNVFKNSVYKNGYFYHPKVMDILRGLSKEPQITFGQQGFTHYCPDCFEKREKRDPWHENKCLYDSSNSFEKQRRFMRNGKLLVEGKLGKSPVLYCAPNHQSDEITREVAKELGFEYFADKAVINHNSYQENGMIILPERKIWKRGQIHYVHYDEMSNCFNRCLEIVNKSVPLAQIKTEEKDTFLVILNEFAKLTEKRARDFKRRFSLKNY